MEYFSSFNISFIPRDNNHKEDSLALLASLSNPNNIQGKMSFNVERDFQLSMPNNIEYLQVFENDECWPLTMFWEILGQVDLFWDFDSL
jgi:hypothetical protein